jgi:hypothetical protein
LTQLDTLGPNVQLPTTTASHFEAMNIYLSIKSWFSTSARHDDQHKQISEPRGSDSESEVIALLASKVSLDISGALAFKS